MTVLGFVGSLRKGSYNRALYREFVARLPKEWAIEEGVFAGWPLFNEDAEVPTPQGIEELKAQIRAADAIIVATPEYNRTIPGGLKNMLDWTSRGELPWVGKKVFVMGASSGERGANMSQYDFKRVMMYFGAVVLGQPEVYVSNNAQKFDAELRLTDERTKQTLDKAAAAFVAFVQRS